MVWPKKFDSGLDNVHTFLVAGAQAHVIDESSLGVGISTWSTYLSQEEQGMQGLVAGCNPEAELILLCS